MSKMAGTKCRPAASPGFSSYGGRHGGDFADRRRRAGLTRLGQPDGESGALAGRALRHDPATLPADQRLADGEAEPGSLEPPRREKGIEYSLHHLPRHADARLRAVAGDAVLAVIVIHVAPSPLPLSPNGQDRKSAGQ